MTTYRANLDRIAAVGFPIHVTELDVDGTDDAVQLAGMRKIFPIYWDHPKVAGVTLWGYKQNSHWRNAQGAWLVWSQAGSEGAHRPAMSYIIKHVQNVPPQVSLHQQLRLGGTANGDVVGTVLGADTDAGDVLSDWQIFTGPGSTSAASLFSIDPVTGVVSVADATALAADPATSFKIHVSVSDGYHRGSPQRVTIVR
jgi:endo-1,4-beta-xylanase